MFREFDLAAIACNRRREIPTLRSIGIAHEKLTVARRMSDFPALRSRHCQLFVGNSSQFNELQPDFLLVIFRMPTPDRIHGHAAQVCRELAHLVDPLSRRHSSKPLKLNRQSFIGCVGRVRLPLHHSILLEAPPETEYGMIGLGLGSSRENVKFP